MTQYDRSDPTLDSHSGLQAVFLANRAQLVRFLAAHGAGDVAEDLLQELWVRVSTAPAGPIAQPLSYLYRAANNLMVDRYRSTRQVERRDRDRTEATGAAELDRSEEPAADRVLIARETLADVEAAPASAGPGR